MSNIEMAMPKSAMQFAINILQFSIDSGGSADPTGELKNGNCKLQIANCCSLIVAAPGARYCRLNLTTILPRAKEPDDGLHPPSPALRLRRPGAAHRQADDGDPSHEAPPGVYQQRQHGDRRHGPGEAERRGLD